MILGAIAGWPNEGLRVCVRYSRGADFSGSCYYDSNTIYVNLGRHNRYPYRMQTHIARPESNRTHWWRDLYELELAGPEELVLFIFLHEFYHFLVRRAGRNGRQKEGRCDRFATRILVDDYGAIVRDGGGRRVDRRQWDFQDLDGFVAAARKTRVQKGDVVGDGPLRQSAREKQRKTSSNDQSLLFPDP
ncbi:MAG: hypothetical protein ACE5EQ_11535 [Phycisphaerae bacterium]